MLHYVGYFCIQLRVCLRFVKVYPAYLASLCTNTMTCECDPPQIKLVMILAVVFIMTLTS